MKEYNVSLPEETARNVEEYATAQGVTAEHMIAELVRRAIGPKAISDGRMDTEPMCRQPSM